MTENIAVSVVAEFHRAVKFLASEIEDWWRHSDDAEIHGNILGLIMQGRFNELFDGLLDAAENEVATWDAQAELLFIDDDVELLRTVRTQAYHIQALNGLADSCGAIMATKELLPSLTWPEGFVIETWTHDEVET